MGSTPRGYKTADTGGADASRKRKDTFDEQFGSGTDSNIMKIDKDITDLEDEINSSKVITIISDDVPTEPCDVWLKPMGNVTLGNVTDSLLQPINLSGAYLNDNPPEDKSMMWVKPISKT